MNNAPLESQGVIIQCSVYYQFSQIDTEMMHGRYTPEPTHNENGGGWVMVRRRGEGGGGGGAGEGGTHVVAYPSQAHVG